MSQSDRATQLAARGGRGSNETAVGDLPGLLRLGVVAILWAIRAFLALFVAFWGAVIVTVSAEAIRGLPQDTNDAELAAVALVLLGATPPLWWWLGRRRLLATPKAETLLSDELSSRKEALIDLYWLTAKAVAFCMLAFVVSVTVAVAVAAIGEGMSGSDPLESDRVMTFVLVSGTLLTGAMWWLVRRSRRVPGGGMSEEGPTDAASSDDTGDLPSSVAEDGPGLDVPEVEAGDWPGAVELDSQDEQHKTSS